MSTLSAYILDFLKEHQEVDVVDFGKFYMKNSGAKVVSENNNILPPAKEIGLNFNTKTLNNGFAEFVASKEGLMYHEAMSVLRKTTDSWISEAQEKGSCKINDLGNLVFTEGEMSFQGERTEDSSPDFFGLEEINLEELKRGEAAEVVEKDSFGKTILWTFLIAVPVAGLVYLAITQKDKIFGKESFTAVKTATHRIPAKPKVAVPIVDSTKVDSLKIDSAKIKTIKHQ